MARLRWILAVLFIGGLAAACSGPAESPTTPTLAIIELPTATAAATKTSPRPVETLAYEDDTPQVIATRPIEEAGDSDNAVFFRTTNRTADTLVLSLDNVPDLPSGRVYQGWIEKEDGSLTSTGPLTVSDGAVRHTWVAPDGENLLATVMGFRITDEPDSGSISPTGITRFAGTFDAAGAELARAIFFSNNGEPVTPRRAPFAPTMLTQLSLAVQHSQNALNANAIGATQETRLHLEHIINILEGSNGARFSDYTNDGRAENPGDGFGVLSYAQAVSDLLDNAEISKDTARLEEEIRLWEDQIIARLAEAQDAPTLQELHDTGQRIFDDTGLKLYQDVEEAVLILIKPVP